MVGNETLVRAQGYKTLAGVRGTFGFILGEGSGNPHRRRLATGRGSEKLKKENGLDRIELMRWMQSISGLVSIVAPQYMPLSSSI